MRNLDNLSTEEVRVIEAALRGYWDHLIPFAKRNPDTSLLSQVCLRKIEVVRALLARLEKEF